MIDTTLPVLNYDLLFNLIRWAEQEEQDEKFLEQMKAMGLFGVWDQDVWGRADNNIRLTTTFTKNVCGSAYCLAGSAAVASDYRLVYDDDSDVIEGGSSADYCIKIEPTGEADKKGLPLYRDVAGARLETIERVGAQVLGLTDEEQIIFNGSNDIDSLKGYANGFCQARGLPLMFPNDEIYHVNDTEDD